MTPQENQIEVLKAQVQDRYEIIRDAREALERLINDAEILTSIEMAKLTLTIFILEPFYSQKSILLIKSHHNWEAMLQKSIETQTKSYIDPWPELDKFYYKYMAELRQDKIVKPNKEENES